ncbi:MAG: glycosyltransferase family 39 protein [Cyanobacteria bacterium]|nr:glycosyltransferase family 39 protein [Cyanobacteriota bacterium]
MQKILKYKSEIILSIVIAFFYFFLRLIFINDLPIFTDEAIYVRWAQIALNDSSWRFISLTDGKQPMFVWAAVVFMKVFNDPLLSSRLVSVVSGFFTMIGLFFLTYELFKSKTMAFLSTILYVFFPFSQVYDRLALYDSMVATFSVWALYLSVHLVKKLRLDIAYSLGFVIGAGVLTKTSNFFSIYMLPFTLLLFDFNKKHRLKRLVNWILLATFSVLISYGLYNVLRLSPLFEMIRAKNAIFVYPFSEWLQHPFTFFVGNLNGLFSWLTEYLTLPYIVLILISLILIRRNYKEKVLLILYFLLPFVALALFGRVIFPRFIYFMSLYLLPLAAWGLNYIINQSLRYTKESLRVKSIKYIIPIIVFVFIWYPGFISYQFAKDPINSKIAKADNRQYINSWAAGWGIKESVSFFREKASNGKIFIATEGTFGLLPAGLEMYLVQNKNITIKGYWPVNEVSKEVLDYAKKMPTYFVFYQKEHVEIPPSFPLEFLFKVRQGNTNYYYRVYQVIP